MQRKNLFTWTVSILFGIYVLIRFVIPYGSMWIMGGPHPLYVPTTLAVMYFSVASLGLAIHITSSRENIDAFMTPIMRFLRGYASGWQQSLRLLVLAAIPLLAGWGAYSVASTKVKTPTGLRIQHPTIPGRFENMVNPFRNPDETMVRAYIKEAGLNNVSLAEGKKKLQQKILQEGRGLYQMNCRPCHGSKADGNGPMAGGFRLRPINFSDPGTLATVVESYAFWRVKEGGRGLPTESTPWNSVMPTWKYELTDAQIWKIILAEYDTAGVEPRTTEKLQ